MSTPQMDAWLLKVLRVAVSDAGAPAATRAPRPATPAPRRVSIEGRARWQEARETIDTRLGRLMSRMEGSTDPEMQRIADLGLGALTRGLNTTLVASLIDVDAAAADKAEAARAKARGAVAAMQRLLASDPLVALIDDNPLGVAVDIRGTLGDALGDIEEALA